MEGERFALLVGSTLGDLKDSVLSDLDSMSAVLTSRCGFKVTKIESPDAVELQRQVATFCTSLKLNKVNVGLFYFSGHGQFFNTIETGGEMIFRLYQKLTKYNFIYICI